MKKLKLIVSLVAMSFAAGSFAQSFTIDQPDGITTHAPLNEYVTGAILITNVSSGDLTLGWEIIEKIVPSGWDYSYCDYNTCYTSSANYGTMMTVTAGSDAFFKVNAMTPNTGWSYFKVKVFDSNNQSDSDTLEYWFNGTASIASVQEKPKMNIYPNPLNSNSELTISNVPANAKVQVLNSLGQQVFVIEKATSNTVIVESLSSKGVYLVRVTSNGIAETRKLVVK